MTSTAKAIAIIGSSFRFPGYPEQSFSEALLQQKDLITQVDSSRWNHENYLHPDSKHPGTSYTFAAGSLGDITGFDANFFGLSPREVMHIDPQQRYLLEMTWEAIESAGYAPSSLRGKECGVYMGVASIDYGFRYLDDLNAFDQNTGTGTTASIAANRVSYIFDFQGPSLVVDTACSSSLVAFHHACEAIRRGEVSIAMAGGVSLHLHPYGFIAFSKASMLSRQGRCRVFDASADGYVRSEGGGVLFLKEYDQAIADGDPLIAVVAASAANADGYKSALTIPNPKAQTALMKKAYSAAGISPDQITYMEAHGTGTPVGDPIEAKAIGEALGQVRQQPLLIGSVKSNVGHLETASGMAGLAKALTCIQTRTIPATIGIKTLNPAIPFDELNLQVVTENHALPKNEKITIGINSFGFGGSNAHVVLQSPEPSANVQPSALNAPSDQPASIVIYLSAHDDEALKMRAKQIHDLIQQYPDQLYDIAWTLRYHRERHASGVWIEAESSSLLLEALSALIADQSHPNLYKTHFSGEHSKPVFVYSGNGCQWSGMGQTLLQESETFRQVLQEVDQYYQPLAQCSLIELIEQATPETYHKTEWAQPALFAIQVGITQLFEEAGVTPAAVTGHSVGEVAAAWASGALSLQQAVEVIYHRSQCQGTTAGQGQMTAVALSAEQMQQELEKHQLDRIAIAGINSGKGITLAGDVDQLALIEGELKQAGVRLKRLDLDYAFHSPAMDSIEADVKAALAHLNPSEVQQVEFYSTVAGERLSGSALTADYWWKNIREPVLFNHSINKLIDQYNVFVEIGAHPVLTGYIKEAAKEADHPTVNVLPTLSRELDQLRVVKQAMASVWSSGADVDWSIYFPVEGQRFNLPAYPWQRESFMTPQTPESLQRLTAQRVHPLLGKPLTGVAKCWESHLDLQLWPWLSEHKIGEAVLFPGSGFIELALAAAFIQDKRHVLEIEELEIRSPLLLSAAPSKKVRTRFEGDQGKIVVESRDFNTSDDFTQHLTGRLLPETAGLCLLQSAEPLPSRSADISRQALNQAAASAELFYGESFQCIAESWLEGDSIIGRVEPEGDAAQSASDYRIHPGILDSAFQLVMALLYLKGDADVVYVPVQVGRLQWHYSDDSIAQAKVTLKRQLPHSLLLDVALYDGQGNCLAFLQDVRMRAMVLKQDKVHQVDLLSAALYPMPLPSAPGVSVDLQHMEQGLESVLEQDTSYQAYVLEVEPLLDSFAEQQLQRVVDQQNLLQPLAQRIAKHHDLALDDEQDIDPQAIWYALLHDYPAHFALVQSLSEWHYKKPLDEQLNPISTEVDQGDLQQDYTHLLRLILSETAHHGLANEVQNTLQRLQSEQLPGQRLRIVEISGCEPWWAPWVLDVIDAQNVDYQCVIASDPAKGCASSLLSKYPAMSCFSVQQWVEQETPSAQQAQLDCALVTLDIADLSLAKEVLETLHRSLQPTGEALLMLHHPSLWLDCALAHYPQWWVGDTHTQQASWSQWRDLLQRIGFVLLQDGPDPLLQSGFYLLRVKCQKDQPEELHQRQDETHTQFPYFVVGNQLADGLANELMQKSGRVETFLHLDELDQVLTESCLAEPLNVVLLPDAISPRETSGGQDIASERCVLLHQWAMKLANYPLASGSRVYLVTHGVSTLFNPKSALSNGSTDSLSMPNDVALWGFVRTLMNEVSQIDWRLIDVPFPSADAAVQVSSLCQDLQQELMAHSAETEVIYTQAQARYAVRFDHDHTEEQQDLAAYETLTLGFTLPGQLRNLAWQRKQLPELSSDEILVQVKATGLNFRDVMYALGLLSDEAIENGYSGPTLGLEFAGEVIAVGADNAQYKVGDAVVGFGPASFSTQLVANVSAIAHLPEGMTYEAAATIPTTFFTAWYALKHCAQLQAGERILIHGAAGGVGIAAIQIAQALGAEIYATAGSDEKRAFLSLLGVEHIFDSRSNIFAEQILATTEDSQGVDVVLNSLAGESIAQNLRALKPFGRFLELGKRDFYENTPMGLRPFRNNLTYFGIDSDQLMKVKPELTTQLFKEVMQQFRLGQLFPLPYTLFTAERVEEAFRFMQQAKQIGKVVVTYPRAPKSTTHRFKADVTLQLSDQGIYLVTGGLSGFGFRTAQWLVEKGATSLAVISRSGQLSETVRSQLNKWQRQGINVQTAACDITDAQALKRCLDDLTQDQPLIGIVHAAAVYDDALVQQLSAEQINRVMNVKIQGAINLQQLSDQLQLFVLFSSATTLFGNPGQSHYVAANYWLEGFAAWRRQQGLAATCVNWGPINDVGYLSRETQVKEQLNSRLGTDALNSVDALTILERMLIEQQSGVHALYLDWSSLSRYLPSADQPKYAVLNRTAQDKGQGGDHQTELHQLLASGQLKEAEGLLITILTTELSNILLLPESRIDASEPIYDLGFDSLMAAELMAAIDGSLGVKLPVMALNDRLTLHRLAALILEKLNPQLDQTSEADELEALKSKHGEAE